MKIIGLFIGAFFLYQGVDSLVRALTGDGDFDISGVTSALAGLYLIYKALMSSTEPAFGGKKNSSPITERTRTQNTSQTLPSDASISEVNRLIDDGQIMDAIRRYRAETGQSLKECKAYIDNYIKQKEEHHLREK